MGAILDSCCGDNAAGIVMPSDQAADFLMFAQSIHMMPSDDDPSVFDYGLVIDGLPRSNYQAARLTTRFPIRFPKRQVNATLIHQTLPSTWSIEPPVPGVSSGASVYALLDQLLAAGWAHPPHKDPRLFSFGAVRQHMDTKGGMTRELYATLFPKPPREDSQADLL